MQIELTDRTALVTGSTRAHPAPPPASATTGGGALGVDGGYPDAILP